MTTETMREAVEVAIGYAMATVVSGNNMPHASGDPRNRLLPLQRRNFDRAVQYAADAAIRTVLERIREPTAVVRLVGGYTQKHGNENGDTYAYAIWQAMIDATLGEYTDSAL